VIVDGHPGLKLGVSVAEMALAAVGQSKGNPALFDFIKEVDYQIRACSLKECWFPADGYLMFFLVHDASPFMKFKYLTKKTMSGNANLTMSTCDSQFMVDGNVLYSRSMALLDADCRETAGRQLKTI
jgi:hypothetical protein